MESKNKYLFVFVWFLPLFNLFSCRSVGQNVSIIPNNFNTYNELIYNTFRYYADSISRNGNSFIVGVCISKFDTAKEQLKVILDYTFGNPIPYLNTPTHIKIYDNRIYVIRFDSLVNKKLIKRFDFQPITKDDIAFLIKTGDLHMKKNHNPTGYSQSLVLELKDNTLVKKWYEYADHAPREDRVLDFEWIKNQISYEEYLFEKLKGYGY